MENLHLKDKYGRKNFSNFSIAHEYTSSQVLGPQKHIPQKNFGTIYAPPIRKQVEAESRNHSIKEGSKDDAVERSHHSMTKVSNDSRDLSGKRQ